MLGVIAAASIWATGDGGPGFSQQQEVTIPEVAQRPAEEVVAELTALGLEPVQVPQPDPRIPVGHVISSDPIAGKRLAVGSEITLVVSTGLPILSVPNVMRMSPVDARRALEEAGFQGRVVNVDLLTQIERYGRRRNLHLARFSDFASLRPCPPVDLPAWDSPNRSLYLLYGHLEQAPSFTTGDTIECGQLIGTVGNTGMSGNPHLHLEVRVGPGGTIFPGLAHYDNAALPEEMAYYCAWRVSGLFQLMDPLALLRAGPVREPALEERRRSA